MDDIRFYHIPYVFPLKLNLSRSLLIQYDTTDTEIRRVKLDIHELALIHALLYACTPPLGYGILSYQEAEEVTSLDLDTIRKEVMPGLIEKVTSFNLHIGSVLETGFRLDERGGIQI